MFPFRLFEHDQQLQALGDVAGRAAEAFGLRVARREVLQYEDNAVYRLTDGGGFPYVLRISAEDGASAGAQASEVEWLRWLRADGQAVPEPVAAPQGDFVLQVGSELVQPRVCVLFRWLAGELPAGDVSEAQMARLGDATARLHAPQRAFEASVGFTRPRLDWGEVLDREADADAVSVTGHRDLLARLRERLSAELGESSSEPAMLIHGDLHRDNILFEGDGVRFIDFDDCGWGHPLYDVASLLDSFRRRVVAAADYPRMRSAFFEGYGASMSRAERAGQLAAFKALRDAVTLRFITSSTNQTVQGWAQARVAELEAHLRGYLDGESARI